MFSLRVQGPASWNSLPKERRLACRTALATQCLGISTCKRRMKMSHITTLLVLLLSNLGISKPADSPADIVTVVLAGDPTVLRCSRMNLNLRHFPICCNPYRVSYMDIYMGGKFVSGFDTEGFHVVGNKTQDELDIFIEKVTDDRAGIYECLAFEKVNKSFQLIVLENAPVCQISSVSSYCSITEKITCNSSLDDSLRTNTNELQQYEFIGPNSCGIPQDQIFFSCSVTYTGNKSPGLELRNLKDNKVIESSCCETVVDASKSRKRLTCRPNVLMKAELDLDGAQFICQTKQSPEKQYNCTTNPIKIQYSFHGDPSDRKIVHLNDTVDCKANCSQSDNYTWTWWRETSDGVEQLIKKTQILTAERSGSYICKAECQIGTRSCAVNAIQVESLSPPSESVGDKVNAGSKMSVPIIVTIFTMGHLLGLWHGL